MPGEFSQTSENSPGIKAARTAALYEAVKGCLEKLDSVVLILELIILLTEMLWDDMCT